MFRESQNWNSINENNIAKCLQLIEECGFDRLNLPADVQDFTLELASNHKCDPKVLFYTVLSGVGHFSESTNVYNIETKQLRPITVYEILIAPSGILEKNRKLLCIKMF